MGCVKHGPIHLSVSHHITILCIWGALPLPAASVYESVGGSVEHCYYYYYYCYCITSAAAAAVIDYSTTTDTISTTIYVYIFGIFVICT